MQLQEAECNIGLSHKEQDGGKKNSAPKENQPCSLVVIVIEVESDSKNEAYDN